MYVRRPDAMYIVDRVYSGLFVIAMTLVLVLIVGRVGARVDLQEVASSVSVPCVLNSVVPIVMKSPCEQTVLCVLCVL